MLCLISKGNELNYESKKADIIDKTKEYILSNYNKSLSVNEIADTVHMSVSFFSKKKWAFLRLNSEISNFNISESIYYSFQFALCPSY